MKVRVFLTPSEIADTEFRGKTAVVIDVLRAATSIARAKASGAGKMFPVPSIEAATRLAATLDRESTLLCGEREGRRIDGFHLGNSPYEYTPEAVGGRTLIVTTSNGTDTIARFEGAREIVVCGLVNVAAVAAHVKDEAEIFVGCSGCLGRFALEDAVCAGSLIARLRALGVRPRLEDDGAAVCDALYAFHAADLAGCLRGASHGRALAELGFADDLIACAAADSLATVPVVRDGRIL